MQSTDRSSAPIPPVDDALEAVITDVERRLAGLAQSLLERDGGAIDTAATALQQSLARALDAVSRAAHRGAVPPALRQRLVVASGQVANQRNTLARATAALDRAIEVLLPREASGYTANGAAALQAHSGLARA
ncbi:hypothetical protein [Methylibium sp.]|uniref:hypothetical protein n=1 Tax=Methylibium sp. TaxID=2067992 RepID=UPI0018049A80|nr:hypothetical protein [Methylibium sp.]MBA3592108.1 hypothetical protein [Methylibium sp.]